jgi:hypothetical protein
MKRTIFLPIFALFILITSSSLAAGAVKSLTVQQAGLTACNGPLIEGTITVAAYDSGGTLLNDAVPLSALVYANHSNGTVSPIAWDFLAGQAYHFAITAGSAPVTSVTLQVAAASNTSVMTPTVTIGCDGSVSFGGSSGGSGVANGDARLNTFHCDLTAALYSTYRGIEVWEIQPDSSGLYQGSYTQDDIAEYAESAPESNTVVAEIWPTTLELLTTGELQIKIAPDAEGKSCAIILDAIPPTFVYFR